MTQDVVAPIVPKNPLAELDIRVVESPADVAAFWTWLTKPGRTYVAADTETTGTNPFEIGFRVRLIQFGDTMSGWAIPFNDWRGLVSGAFEWLARNGVRSVWHNLAFDNQALRCEGITLQMPWQEDTFIWAGLINQAGDSRALKTLSAQRFGRWAEFGQALLHRAMKNADWTWATVPGDFGPYVKYGVVDTILTARLWELWETERLKYQWHHSLEIATIDSTNRMSRNGLGVNTIYARDKAAELQLELNAVMVTLEEHGITSLSQNAKIGQVLEEAGVLPEFIQKTDSGQISVTKEVLGKLDHPVAEAILLGRHIAKTKGYLDGMISFAGGVMGTHELIHPEIRSVEAKTGRMSIANPALQQLPAGDPTVRTAIVPRHPDHVLIGADFGQIELRMFAAITRDEALLAVLNAADVAKDAGDPAGDFFVMLGRDLYDPDFLKSDPRRQYLKATCYAKLYSAGIETIARTAKVPIATIGAVVRALEERYPAFRTLGDELITQLPGPIWEVHTPTGRRFAVSEQGERRKLMNYLVQGHSAEILKMALQNVVEAGYADYLMLPVHDEIIMSVPRDIAKQATDDLVECMNAVIDPSVYGVAVKASPAPPADNWGLLTH